MQCKHHATFDAMNIFFFPIYICESYVYIFIAIALDEAVILVAVHFSMKNIMTSCIRPRFHRVMKIISLV